VREGKRWTKMPLLWERAAGGPTPPPGGVRRDGSRDLYGQLTLPNLRRPGHREAIDPIGLGPIAAGWSDRRRRSEVRHGRGAGARAVRRRLRRAYFQAGAPARSAGRGAGHNERITLENLHPKTRAWSQPARPAPRALVEIAGRRRASWRSRGHALDRHAPLHLHGDLPRARRTSIKA